MQPITVFSPAQQQLALALQHAHGFIIAADERGQVQFQLGAIDELLTTKIHVGRSLPASRLARSAPDLVRRIERVLSEQIEDHFEWFNPECQRWIGQHLYPTQGGVTAFGFDLTGQRKLPLQDDGRMEQLVYQASDDLVTGLMNRRAFQAVVDRACRGQFGRKFSVVLIDLDGFTNANDALGNTAGDRLLAQVADRLRTVLGESDFLGRMGNDEFAILHCEGRSPSRPTRIVSAVIESMRRPFYVEEAKVRLTASVGVAVFPEDGRGHERLLTAADVAVNRVKQEGGNGWRRFQPGMQVELDVRRDVHEGLLEAISGGQLTLHYQPVIDLRRGVVAGLEALVRWNHPVRGLIAPAHFLQIAEDQGTIIPVGEWAILTACREAMDWPGYCTVGINLSPCQFRSNIMRAVSQALAESRIDPARVTLEVTDAALADERERNLEALKRLRGLGVKIALDAFGTGCASFRALQQFPFDQVKLDRNLVGDMCAGREMQLVVRSVVALACDLGIEVVAQGVETLEELNQLREAGCRSAQGFLFSKPLSRDDALRYLRTCAAGQS